MSYLAETSTWEPGVYQLETTDPVIGGPDGVSNTPAKQLANRTKYLKDRVDATDTELDSLSSGIDDEAQNALIAGVSQATSLGGVNAKAIDDIRRRVFSQGTVVIKNKWVVSGLVMQKADIRALHLTKTGTYTSGNRSAAFIDGRVRYVADDDYHVTVPSNSSDEVLTVWAYLHDDGGEYRVGVGEDIPDDGLKLCELTIPAGDTAGNLDAVTLTDRRTVQAWNGYFITSVQDAYVALPFPALNAPDYDVVLSVQSADDKASVGNLEVTDKLVNGFRVRHHGSCDNLVVRWTLANINN